MARNEQIHDPDEEVAKGTAVQAITRTGEDSSQVQD